MAYNGSGTFVRLYNWITDRNAAVKIRADRMDAEMDGFATGLSTAITKDGQTTITANIPMSNFKLTGLGDATSGTDALNRQTADARYGLQTTYDANSILKADSDNTPVVLAVAEQRMIGRLTGGVIAALTAAQVAEFVRPAFADTLIVTGSTTAMEFADVKTYLELIPQNYASNLPKMTLGTDGTGWAITLTDGADNDGRLNFNVTTLTWSGIALLRMSDTNLTKAFTTTAVDGGNIGSGTYTPTPTDSVMRYYTNTGAHTFAAPSAANDYSMVVLIKNGGSSGAITFSGFETIDGDTYATTSTHRYLLFITKIDGLQYGNLKRIV